MSEAVNAKAGKRVKIKSKCGTRCNDGVDRISQLPDDIIVDILSNLTLRDAARTTVLSTRWKDLWRYTPVLDLTSHGYIYCEKTKFIKWVNSIVVKHKAHFLKKIVISYRLKESSHSAITKWLEFAFSKRVEVMDLCFHADIKKVVVLGELLRLRPNNLLKSSNLKSLCLGDLKVSGEAIKLILRDCHLLERLKIYDAVFTSDIEVCGGATSLALNHLEISDCICGKWIKLSAPNLTRLRISENYSDNDLDVFLLIENVSKLVEVNFDSTLASNIQEFCFVSQLRILTIEPFDPLDFSAKGIPTMPKLIELNVCYFGRSEYLVPSVSSLVRAYPLLQTFNIRFEDDIEDMEVGNVERFEHHHLKVFKFSGFDVVVDDHVELVRFILQNCVVLCKIIIEVDDGSGNLSPEIERAKKEADMDKVKQLVTQFTYPRLIHVVLTEYINFI